MAVAESPRSNSSAVLAVRGILGCSEEAALEVVEAVRPHLERPLLTALAQSRERIADLEAGRAS